MFAHIPGLPQKAPVEPLYSAAAGPKPHRPLLHGAPPAAPAHAREERKYGRKSDYTGTDMFLSLGERSDPEDAQRVAELSVQRAVHQPASAPSICRSARAAPTSGCSTT